MKQYILPLVAVAALGACQSDIPPATDPVDEGDVTDEGGVTGMASGAGASVTIYELADSSGGGTSQSIVFDSVSNTITIDGLAFDGDNIYAHNPGHSATLTNADVYDGPATASDPFTPDDVLQFLHRAIYAQSSSGDVEFGLVRSGAYVGYGFGGFVFMRNNGVTLPTSEQASYFGDYNGLRVYSNSSGLALVTGDAEAAIDFEDFNTGDGVRLYITNRTVHEYNDDGTVLTDISTDVDPDGGGIPELRLVVGPGTIDSAGNLQNTMQSNAFNSSGDLAIYESGTFYGLLAGDNAEELVGIVVVEGLDPRFGDSGWEDSDVSYKETGGVIAYR